jgi:hypothetical protein
MKGIRETRFHCILKIGRNYRALYQQLQESLIAAGTLHRHQGISFY